MRFVALAALIAALAAPVLAQSPTGTLTGRTTDGKETLPGVTVTVTSPNLQGARTAVSEVTGDYIFRYLPPGDYKVRFELQGFQSIDTTVKISVAQTATINAVMPVAKVAEEVTVTGTYDTISSSQQAATTFEQNLLNTLPVGRTLVTAASLTPGVSNTGPSNNLVISGAPSYQNLFMVNGVVIQDNVRNTPLQLYIEDAVQETTTSTAGISAEYGRFAGGVVNTLTKSGGNELHASIRDSLTSDKWAAKTPLTITRNEKINGAYEATLGGFFMKDRLWFFAAGRSRDLKTDRTTYATNLPYTNGDKENRYEGKLTFSFNPNHRVMGSYIKVDQTATNASFGTILDLASVDETRSFPQDLFAANYNGVFTDNFFAEAQYSKRKFTFEGYGSNYKDYILGTVIRDNVNYFYSNSPYFCGVCDPEKRDNEDWVVKGSWFLTSPTVGSHDIVFGYDSFNDMRQANNYQSGSNFIYWPTQYLTDAAGHYILDSTLHQPIPVVYGDGSSDFTYWAILNLSQGTNFRTNSTFVNDKWRLNNHFSFNLGVRYDKNDGEDASHAKVAKDSRISPRFGLSYDFKADGDIVANIGYGHYVTAIAGSVADQGGGNPSSFGYLYEGADLNTTGCTAANPGACLNAHQVLQKVFDWLFANGKNSIGQPIGRSVDYGSIAGLSNIVGPNLSSPYAEEFTVGVTKRLGSRGIARLDYVRRNYKDFYATTATTKNGTVTDTLGNVSDLKIIGNTDQLQRKYDGINLQASYRLADRWNLGGNYTWSHLQGNVEGESSGSGPTTSGMPNAYYPEYVQMAWNQPIGDLSADRRHTGRVWAIWDIISDKHHSLSASVMESYFSGSPYSAAASIYSYPYVTNPGYATRPTTVTYYFSKRGAYLTDNITRTDISFNYGFRIPALGADLEFFVHPMMTNVFNERAVVNVDTTIYTRYNSSNWLLFNPFTTAPTECPQSNTPAQCKAAGNNWQKGPNWGKPLSSGDYQTPRTFSVSFGVRF
jgi:outer membrane receptor protein involved in Fe transport